MVGGSVVGLLILATGLPVLAAMAVLVVAFAVPCVYSFVHYKALERRGEL